MARRSITKILKGMITGNKVNLLLFALCAIIISTFIVSALLQDKGTFTIEASQADMIAYGLVLSDTRGFDRPRPELIAAPVVNMWNITQSQLPTGLQNIDGSHNGANYLAYTFYVKNEGDAELSYQASINITDLYKAVDEAMRLKIYVNGVYHVYAKQKSDGSGEPEPGTIPFAAKVRIVNFNPKDLKVGQIDKYTVIVWLEGEDPDCNNSILGGSVKMEMQFDASVPSKKGALAT